MKDTSLIICDFFLTIWSVFPLNELVKCFETSYNLDGVFNNNNKLRENILPKSYSPNFLIDI